MKKINVKLLALLLSAVVLLGSLVGCDLADLGLFGSIDNNDGSGKTNNEQVYGYASVDGIPDYSGKPYVILNNNIPSLPMLKRLLNHMRNTRSLISLADAE